VETISDQKVTTALMDVSDLRVYYRTKSGEVRAVDGVTFAVHEGENFGLVGESGCGKTTVAKALLRVLPENARVPSGAIDFRSRDLLSLPTDVLNTVRWRELSLVTQSAMNALDPVQRVGDQIVETIRVHQPVSRAAARKRAEELFALVGLEANRLDDYPHQLSGGMRQRAVIATALALEPSLIVADEPTTALDVVVQDGILGQLQHIQDQANHAMILVTHDISVVAETCQRVAVMYAGKIVEIGRTADVLSAPFHPYTMGLLNAFPTLESAKGELVSIPGSPPDLTTADPDAEIVGCRFAARCPFATEQCRMVDPPQVEVAPGHLSACHYVDRVDELRKEAATREAWLATEAAVASGEAGAEVMTPESRPSGSLQVRDLRRHFPLQRGIVASLLGESDRKVHAVDGIDLEIEPGVILGLAGESGSGKSTLGEIVCGLQPPTTGEVVYDGQPVRTRGKGHREYRRNVQMVFQDPYQTLNPRFTITQTVEEPLRNFKIGDADERRERVREALRRAGLPDEQLLERYPHELSGGQRQRVAIARGIVLEPTLLVADEPVSMLDVSLRAGVLNLFKRFRDELGMSILYVSHDLATIRYICDRTAVMYLGRVVEIGPTSEVIDSPMHPYTELLLSAVPESRAGEQRQRVDARGEIPDPIDLPNGCRFHGRCSYALAGAGWEGRDLAKLVEQRRMAILDDPGSARAGEADLLAAIETMVPSGTDVEITAASGQGAAVADYLKVLMAESDRPIDEAVTEVSAIGDSIVVRFPVIDEPDYHSVGDRQVYCGRPPWCSGVGSTAEDALKP
jgi:peptide/nickel transport system ATP-binding protein